MQLIIVIAKSFGPCQPARTAQTDMGRYISQCHQAPFFHRTWLISVVVNNLNSVKYGETELLLVMH